MVLSRGGILGPGVIAKAFVAGIKNSGNGHVVAIGSRSLEHATSFASEMDLPDATCHEGYDALLADDAVQAVYIATPHPMHARWAIAAAKAGKHIVCEKPVGLNHAEAMAIVEHCRRHRVFFMEAFKDRCHPQTHRLLELLRDNAIGQVRVIQASFGFGGGDEIQNPEGRAFNAELGGGGILDVGCYAVALVRLIAGVAVGQPFANPVEVRGAAHLGETSVDEWAAATLRFSNGIVAQVATAVRASLHNTATIIGSRGRIDLPNPWLNSRDTPTPGTILLSRDGKTETIEVPAELTSFGYEARVAADAILAGQLEPASPAMTLDDTLGQMATLDAWRTDVKLAFPGETPEVFATPLTGNTLTKAADAPMTYGRLPGLDRDISKLVMGCDNQRTFAHAAVMFDDWFELGGNTFDTAHLYGGGLMERLLGQWHRSRNVLDRINIIVKGGHTPFCTPEHIHKQFLVSLERLQIDYAPIYLMHRDNLDVPVSEFVDVLSALVDEGKLGVFGGSNWRVDRFAEANAYAKAKGKHPFTMLSNNFSLARMQKPVWNGCVAASNPDARRFLIEHRVPNLAWSSQARGYFVSPDGGGVGKNEPDEIWDGADNRERRRRAFALAQQKNVTAINIAAAYVLCQPFPSFALIGPRTLHELTTTLPALDLQLTEAEMAHLDLRD